MNRVGVPCLDARMLYENKVYKNNRSDGTHHEDTGEVRLKDSTHHLAGEEIMYAHKLLAGYAGIFAPWFWTKERFKKHLEESEAFTRSTDKTERPHKDDAMAYTSDAAEARMNNRRADLGKVIRGSVANTDTFILPFTDQEELHRLVKIKWS